MKNPRVKNFMTLPHFPIGSYSILDPNIPWCQRFPRCHLFKSGGFNDTTAVSSRLLEPITKTLQMITVIVVFLANMKPYANRLVN
jgi:hypothetical protein